LLKRDYKNNPADDEIYYELLWFGKNLKGKCLFHVMLVKPVYGFIANYKKR